MRWISFCLLCLSLAALAQQQEEAIYQIESYDLEDENIDISELMLKQTEFISESIDLNKAGPEVLQMIPGVSTKQVMELIEHRRRFGDFVSLYELQLLESFDREDIKAILPYLKLGSDTRPTIQWLELFSTSSQTIFCNFSLKSPKNKGTLLADLQDVKTAGSYYAGSPLYNNLRYSFNYKNTILFGANFEKDAGERLFSPKSKYAIDYNSFYIAFKSYGKIKSFHLGDFQVNLGQGLCLSTGLAMGKSGFIGNTRKNYNGFDTYRSLRENAYLRGVALAVLLGSWEIGVFASSKNRDANVDMLSGHITSLTEDGGLHRTPGEIEDIKTTKDQQIGSYVQYHFKAGHIGAVLHQRLLSRELEVVERNYNHFHFGGNTYIKQGWFYDIYFHNLSFFGEISTAFDQSKPAQLHGLLLALNRELSLSILYRDYPKETIYYQSSAFSESSMASNETGLFLGLEIYPAQRLKISAYTDFFHRPWLSFSTNAPFYGYDNWLEIHYNIRRKFSVYYRFRSESKAVNNRMAAISEIQFPLKKSHRIHVNYLLKRGMESRTRLEWNRMGLGDYSSGSILYSEIICKIPGNAWQVSFRYALTEIEQYDNRIYSFEQVPLYNYPLMNHYYSGTRAYCLLRYRFLKQLNIWFKYGLDMHRMPLRYLQNNYYIGSGLDEIKGNRKHTFALQIRYELK